MAPAVSLKILHGPRPSLKEAFSPTDIKGQSTADKTQKTNTRAKTCTSHFGCTDVAIAQEQSESGALYCREHKPKQVPVLPIKNAEKKPSSKKKSA